MNQHRKQHKIQTWKVFFHQNWGTVETDDVPTDKYSLLEKRTSYKLPVNETIIDF